MYETADQARARHARSEADWQGLSSAQRRGVAFGYATMLVALLAGSMQQVFNGVSIAAIVVAAIGFLIVLRALGTR